MPLRILLLTLLTLLAFASNSILCRFALADSSIDAATFTLVRIVCGALALTLLTLAKDRQSPWGRGGSWLSGALLLSYAAAFSLAYLKLDAGAGGLILFATVQFTMLGVGIAKGERPSLAEWAGLLLAHIGLIVLVAPGIRAPDPLGAALMAIAGASWGWYSLRGRGVHDPIGATAENFVRPVPIAVVIMLCSIGSVHWSPRGIALAAASGAVTSGLGYVLWYAVLPHLSATRAAVSQLAVPALVAIAGVTLLGEHVDARFASASVLMLGGVAMAVLVRKRS